MVFVLKRFAAIKALLMNKATLAGNMKKGGRAPL